MAIDLFCGLGGWTEGLLSEGYRVVGFDVERHRYPMVQAVGGDGLKLPGNNSEIRWSNRPVQRLKDATKGGEIIGWAEYPAQLVLQDVLTIHGRQFKDAALIVASPPCQAYSYRAMPWKRAKALPPPDNSLFEACFRIQREACEASGRFIPLVIENVCGAQKWVGRARWHFGSFYLWGDVPALMPMKRARAKVGGFSWSDHGKPGYKAIAFNGEADKRLREEHFKNKDVDGYKRNHPAAFGWKKPRTSSHSTARKAASAHIAKIPFVLSQHIARAWWPQDVATPR